MIEEIVGKGGHVAAFAILVTNDNHLFEIVFSKTFHDLSKEPIVLGSTPFAFVHANSFTGKSGLSQGKCQTRKKPPGKRSNGGVRRHAVSFRIRLDGQAGLAVNAIMAIK